MPACECCRTAGRPAAAYVTLGRFTARLCATCADRGHARDACLLCGAGVWRCARVAHFAAGHPGLLARLANDPFPEARPRRTLTHLGAVRI
jgi:hypothetical protein